MPVMSDSVKKAFHLIHFLAGQSDRITLVAVSKALKMNKTTTFRYLETLVQLGMVEKSESGYLLGMGLFELGSRVPLKRLVLDRIHPVLVELCAELNETVNLAQLQGLEALYLDKIESRRSLQMQSQIGNRLPLHCTGLGKAILSLLPEARLDQILGELPLRAVTPATVISKAGLKKQVTAIRSKGHAFDDEEYETGLTCIAVPLHLPEVGFMGAFSVSGPSFRFDAALKAEYARRLQAHASHIRALFASH